ncbi:MAG TPA: high frequency lysogenization protein HflD [Pseudomonadales bacterium]
MSKAQHSKQERTIALAGLFQAARMVTDLANGKEIDPHSLSVLIDSLLVLDPPTTLAVYGNDLANLRPGLTLLADLAGQNTRADGETARYVLGMLALERQLARQHDMLSVIRSRLEHLQYKRQHFAGNLRDLSQSLSGLYQDTLSTLRFRIQVTGNMQHLNQADVSDRIRTLLFAGIRSAMLWRQLGGSKWQLIIGRSMLEKTSRQLLQQIPTH